MPTTIIDFTPQALEIDQIAQAAGTINPNVPAPALPTMGNGVVINGTTGAGNTFAANAPDILFCAEYAQPGAASTGVLVVWEDYYAASHYELFKRTYTNQDDSWQRILIIDSVHLRAETASFQDYITNVLKINIPFGYYAILDTNVTLDQIVEYKVAAGSYPTSANVAYNLSLNSQGLLNKVLINSTDTIFDFSTRVFSIPDYAWVVALLNNCSYFGKKAVTETLYNQLGTNYAYVPKDLSIIPQLLQESIYMFGLTATLQNIFQVAGDSLDGDEGIEFFQTVLQCINNNSSLSYLLLQSKLMVAYPNYDDYVARVKSGKVSSPITFTQYSDSTSFVSMADFTDTFSRLNSMLVGFIYANDNDLIARIIGLFAPLTPTPAPAAGRDLLPPAPSPLPKIGNLFSTPKDLLPPTTSTIPKLPAISATAKSGPIL